MLRLLTAVVLAGSEQREGVLRQLLLGRLTQPGESGDKKMGRL